MIPPQKLDSSRVHRYHTSGRLETPIFPKLEADSGVQTTGHLQRKKGKKKHLFCPSCKTCPTHLELSSTGSRGAQPDTARCCPGAWGCQSAIGKNSEIWLLCVLILYLSWWWSITTYRERNAFFFTAGCPNYQIFECTYSSSHIQSYIHILIYLCMCWIRQFGWLHM